jgi:endonuclease-3 related protein
MIGAVLTQNTAWRNVERALESLRGAGLLSLEALHRESAERIAPLIRSSGHFNVKTARLKALAAWVEQQCQFDLRVLDGWHTVQLRQGLLSVKGIGEETADDIVLYAFGRPSFVVDAYTRRVMQRHGWATGNESYAGIQRLWHDALPADPALMNEAHALIVRLAKHHCRARVADCRECPLNRPEFTPPA